MPNRNRNRNRNRDDEGRFASDSWIGMARDRPLASAAAAAGVAAAGVFLWARRGQIGSAVSSGMDRLSEMKSERMGYGSERTQEEIGQEALTLKETGRRSRGPRGPISQQDIKAGMVAH